MKNLSKLMDVKEKKRMQMSSATSEVKNLLVGWLSPTKDWEQWTQKLSFVHESTWKYAGIYKAIKSSIYTIKRHDELILELASRWCSQTNTFVFPWGDATLTLEDMLVLGGFSASGFSAFSCLDSDTESVKIIEQLELARKEICSRKCRCRHDMWVKKFMGSGHELEHAAFLSVWLSRFVFSVGSSTDYLVHKKVFPAAARLSRGIKIALGPVVLAMLYTRFTAFTKIQSGENVRPIDLRAPFHLVQIWAWERFPTLKPVPDCIFSSDDLPRIARWSKAKIPKVKDLKSAMDSCGKAFLWCPYGASAIRAETDPESFMLCMKACEIVGFDPCIERYQPQYVTRQFGFDQDIPCDKDDKTMATKTTINRVKSSTSKVDKKSIVKFFDRASTFQPTITSLYEKYNKQERQSAMSQVKVSGFPPKTKEPITVDSVDTTKVKGLAMEVLNESEHERRKDEVEIATSCDAKSESFMNKIFMDLGLDLEARISRLEDIKKSAACKVKFVGWRANNLKDWESWVNKMCSLHKYTWKKAGIYEAIMSSVYIIKRQDNLILELASRWCSKTNTFDFPWGYATLTLEDMLILGGFSSSGVSALTSFDKDAKSLQIKERLELARLEIARTKSKAALHSKWLEKFIEEESDLQHAAFLSLWLSRHVFSVNPHSINKNVFPVAALLSRGIKIALGPVVLAMLYRDLSLLEKGMRFTQLVDRSRENIGQTNLFAQFHLVQIWAWERFPTLKPVQNCMYVSDNFPRLARWSNVKIWKGKDLRCAIDSAEKCFLWCPYGKFSKQEARDLKSFELIGFDSCIEKYQPQRVARQFGLEQKKNAVDSAPPGFSHRIEVIDVLDSDSSSDSDHDCSVQMTEVFASPDAEASKSSKIHRTQDDEGLYDVDKDYEDELVQLQHSNMVSPHSNTESKVEVMNGSEHETKEDEGEVADNKHDEMQGMDSSRSNGFLGAESSDLQNELAMSCDAAESSTNERSMDPSFDLEARISRLEDIVYGRIKALETARKY
ncbi:hypothetical protein V2J09_002444 [Rumex salicifolius]